MDIVAINNHFENVIKKSTWYGSTGVCRDTNLLFPDFKRKIQAVLATSPIKLLVTETYRSSNRQQVLFEQGATKLKTVGMHHYGLACDFAKFIHFQASWKGDWSFLGKLATANGLVWGGDWHEPTIKHSFQDADHLQYVLLEEQNEIFQLGV